MKVSDLDSKNDIVTSLLIQQGDDSYKIMKGRKGVKMLPVDLERRTSVPDTVVGPHETKWGHDVYPMERGRDSYWVDWDEFQSDYGDFEIVSPEHRVGK